jgi:SAM-dependent methyltransferase
MSDEHAGTGTAVQTWASAEAVAQWQQGAARRAAVLGEATERLLEAAGLRPGLRVLDLGAGAGEQSILAARRVGPNGSVLAVDVSARKLEAAARAAREAGLDGIIATQTADISTLDLGDRRFDVAISRLGIMFMPDATAGLSRVHRALVPGARLAALVWSAPERNPYMSTSIEVVRDMGRLPQSRPTVLRAMSLGAPGVLEQALGTAGFRDVGVQPVAFERHFSSLDETLELLRTGSSAQAEVMRDLDEQQQADAWSEIRRRLGAYLQPDGSVRIPGELLLGTATA